MQRRIAGVETIVGYDERSVLAHPHRNSVRTGGQRVTIPAFFQPAAGLPAPENVMAVSAFTAG